ncbi:MAG: AAA family ATPase [Pseudohongiellaceae bacterium]
MYLQHFGLAQYPFSLTPNTHFFLKLPSHVEVFDRLIETLENQGGFVKITGEVGTGKTMLCRKVLNALENYKHRYVTAYVPHPILSEEGIMHALAEELSVAYKANTSYYDLLKRITEQLVALNLENKCVVLFIDEAQAMPEESLEAIRLLSGASGSQKKLLQVVLFGQPELDIHIEHPSLHKLNSQIRFSYKLPALDRDGVEAYVQHRLTKAGFSGSVMFSRAALDQLYKSSRGIPRLINILAHKSLMAAYGKGQQLVDHNHVSLAVADTESISQDSQTLIRRILKN